MARVGIVALIDEATGYQDVRGPHALSDIAKKHAEDARLNHFGDRTMAKKTTKTKTGGKPAADPKPAAAKDPGLDRERRAVAADTRKIMQDMASRTSIGQADLLELRSAWAELEAAQRRTRAAKEEHDRRREVRDEAQKRVNGILSDLFPVPSDDADPKQQRLGFEGRGVGMAVASDPTDNGEAEDDDDPGETVDEPADRLALPLEEVTFVTPKVRGALKAGGVKTAGDLKRMIQSSAAWFDSFPDIAEARAAKLETQFAAWLDG